MWINDGPPQTNSHTSNDFFVKSSPLSTEIPYNGSQCNGRATGLFFFKSKDSFSEVVYFRDRFEIVCTSRYYSIADQFSNYTKPSHW